MRFAGKSIGLLVLSLVFLAPAARADEIADQIKEGLKQYEEGNLAEAMSSLNFAVGQIQQKQAGRLRDVFPKPLDGWKAEESTGGAAPAMLMGGGVTASRRYTMEKDGNEKSVEIEIVTDSPLLQSVAMFLANPAMMGSQPGSKLIKIKNYKAIQKFNKADKDGEISIVLQGRMLISVRGQNVEGPDEMLAYAGALDYKALEDYLSK